MTREWDDGDDFNASPPQRKNRSNGLVIGLLVAGGIVVLLVAIGVVGLVSWLHEPPNAMDGPVAMAVDHQPAPALMKEEVRRTFTRDDFTQLVMGRSRDEVVAAVGRQPDTRIERGNELYWSYHSTIRDPGDERASVALVDFRDGKVIKVRFGS